MNKNVIIAAIIGVFVIGGGAFALLSNNDSGDDTNASQQQGSDNSDPTDNPLGLDASTLKGPYRINVTTSDTTGRVTDVVADIDGDGNISTTVTDNGQATTIISVDDETYVKSAGEDTYTKFPADESAPVGSEDLEIGFTQDDLDDIDDLMIEDKGTGPCTNGSCRIYETTNPESGDTSTIKITTDSNRISDVEITSADGDEIQISYDYSTNINITAPENFVEFQIPDIGDIDLDSVLENAPQ